MHIMVAIQELNCPHPPSPKLFDLTLFVRSMDPTPTTIMHNIILLIETQSILKAYGPEEQVCGPGPTWRH